MRYAENVYAMLVSAYFLGNIMTTEDYFNELKNNGQPALANMLEWAKHWLETAPLIGDKTKKLLLDFCEENGVDVNLPKKKT